VAPRISVPAVQLSTRAAAAAGLAVGLAHLLGLQYPLYAMIAAVLVTDLSAARTRQLALPRLAGTVVGAAIGAALAPVLDPSVWALAVGVLVAMLASQLLRLHDAAKLAGYVCGIVLLEHREGPWSYAMDRLVETAVGIALAVLVSLVPKLITQDYVKEQ